MAPADELTICHSPDLVKGISHGRHDQRRLCPYGQLTEQKDGCRIEHQQVNIADAIHVGHEAFRGPPQAGPCTLRRHLAAPSADEPCGWAVIRAKMR